MKRLFFVFCFLFFVFTPVSFAQVDTVLTPTTTPVPVDYQLAYHGLLPDNPLYFLKVLRDRLIDFLIADPLKKAEFYLLQADKHATSGVALFVKGKQDLAETTISKGENYFEAGIEKLREAKKQGTDTNRLIEAYTTSLQKHKELVTGLVAQSGGDVKKKLAYALVRLERFEKQVTSLRLK